MSLIVCRNSRLRDRSCLYAKYRVDILLILSSLPGRAISTNVWSSLFFDPSLANFSRTISSLSQGKITHCIPSRFGDVYVCSYFYLGRWLKLHQELWFGWVLCRGRKHTYRQPGGRLLCLSFSVSFDWTCEMGWLTWSFCLDIRSSVTVSH